MNPRSQVVTLHTEDGVSLKARHYLTGHSQVILIAHGLSQNKDTKIFRAIAESFIKDYDVLVLDFRGHGKSGGRFTFTAKESRDLLAALHYLDGHYESIGILCFSLGAMISLVTAANTSMVKSLITVSPAVSFEQIHFHFWRIEAFWNLIDNLSPQGRGKGYRLGFPFYQKPKPIEHIAALKELPCLFIHGDRDWIMRPKHSRKLYDAKPGKKELRIVRGGLHAEKLMDQFPTEFPKWILEWFHKTL